MSYFPQFSPGSLFLQSFQNELYGTIQKLKGDAKDALKHNNNAFALDAYNEAISLALRISLRPEELGTLHCNRSLVYYNLKDYRNSLHDATQATICYPGFNKGYFRQGLAHKGLNEPVTALSRFIEAINVCRQINSNAQDMVACYAAMINILCEVEDIFDLELQITDPESNEVKDLILQRLSLNGQWKAISYLLLGAITGADSKLAGSFSNCSCSDLLVLNVFAETSDTQKKEWGCKLAIKLLQNGASFQEFENGLNENVICFGINITFKTGNAEFLKYLLTSHTIEPSKINAQSNGDTALHILVKDLEIRKTTIGETIIGLLINHGCRLDIKDNAGKTPIEYTSIADPVFRLLQNASNNSTGGGISTSISRFRMNGKDAFQAGNFNKALKIYTEGLANCSHKRDFKNEAILYTNRATVYNKLKHHEMALQDAKSAIQADPTWHKGYWRKGKELCILCKYDDAFETFLCGFEAVQRVCDVKDKIDLIIGAVIAFPYIPDIHKDARYSQLSKECFVQFWPHVVNRLSKESEWIGIRYLILGLNIEIKADKTGCGFVLSGCGIANSFDTSKMQLNTVFKFIEKTRGDRSVSNWLTHTLIILLFKHVKQYLNFKQDASDTHIHAAVRYALITGDVRLLQLMPIQGTRCLDEYRNGNQESPYHIIADNKYTQDHQLMRKVISILREKDLSVSFRDDKNHLPIDYHLKEQFGGLQEELKKISCNVMTSVHSQRDCPTATKNKPEIFKAVKPKLQTKQIYTDEDHKHKDEDKCYTCQETFDKCKTIILENPSLAFKGLLRVFRLKHKHSRHKEIVEKSVLLISDFLAETTDFEIPDELCRIAPKTFDNLINDLIKREKWIQIYKLVIKHNKVHGEKSLCGFASQIRLEKLIKDFPNKMSSNLMEMIIDCFIRNGSRVDKGGKVCIETALERKQYPLLQILICNHHCDPQYLTIDSCCSPIHSAFILGLHKDPGNFSVFKTCMELFSKHPEKYVSLDPRQKDKNGDTLFHLVVKGTCTKTLRQMAEILLNEHVPCEVQNKDGYFPLDYLKVGDHRYKILQKAMEYDRSQIKSDVEKKDSNNQPTVHKPTAEMRNDPDTLVVNMSCQERTKYNGKTIDSMPKIQKESYLSQIEKLVCSLSQKTSTLEHSSVEPRNEIDPGIITLGNKDKEDSEFDQIVFEISHDPLEGKLWEVECTSGVLKSLQSNRILPVLKRRIVKIIDALASGIYSKRLLKPLMTDSESVKLFESKISSASRLIWEVGKQFSSRLTKQCTKPVNIYTDIIRIWEVVMEHKNIHQAVERIVSSIEKSHIKGTTCRIQKKLKICGMQVEFDDVKRLNNKSDNRDYKKPNIYVESGYDKEKLVDEISFFPPASPKGTEYNSIKFYPFSSDVALNVLHQMKGEFPFRVTDVEYQIMNLPFNAPIVLIGRSGTGKTTCCVYRLWYRFQQFWWTKIKDEAILENLKTKNPDQFEEEKNAITKTCIPNEQELINKYGLPEKLYAEPNGIQPETTEKDSGACFDKGSFASKEGANNNCKTEVIIEPNFNEDSIITQEYDKMALLSIKEEVSDSRSFDEYKHELRQMFITKNCVLCREVQKKFKSFIDGDEKTSRLFKIKDEDLPNRLQDIEEHQYPLFITAKHFWLMLDATLGPPYYFDRHIDGSPKTEVGGWTDIDHMQTVLDDAFDNKFSDESESDEEEEELDLHSPPNLNKITRMIKIDPRREVTYEVFEDIIWPRIVGKFKKHTRKYHPSLVWTEIMSIIKGSYEAISEGGILKKDKYFEIGKKQAPAFIDEREVLYKLFLEYERIRQNRHMFDQTDLVRNLYQRFRKQKNKKWKVNEIYVDEAQDFAQAELVLLIKLCESPHGMFVTGDTAQSIMKGISFRFKDLVSLFHQASKELPVKTVGVSVQPDRIYELPHNYRSHSGITALASSVLDILKDLFPDSFDILPNDQCLFNGPNPILLETVSSDRLSLILCDNKRETSKIEFGAHQVILVVNDKSRNNIPNEMKSGLVLTLYEAKGLEFDDVLLYNIFTDSEATKEWRVVFSFLEKLARNESRKESRPTLQISADSRPLTFDPKQHKVLNSELKQLYTAITRARQNVWIFDEDKDKRNPMFEYFKALHLVNIVPEGKEVKSFTRKSSSTEWVATGEEFMKKKMYFQAAQCFNTAGDSRKEDIANAFQHYKHAILKSQNSPDRKDELYQATINFLKARKTEEAAKCLETAKHFDLAAQVYAKRQQFEKAAEMYRITEKPFESCKYYERAGRFEKAIDVLLENKQFENAIKSLKRYEGLKKENPDAERQKLRIKLRGNQTEDQIYTNAAEYYHKKKDCDEMKKALNRISDIHFRVKFLKERFDDKNDYINLAASIYKEKGQSRNAASLYFEYGYTQEALNLFKKDKATYMIGRCLFLDSLMKITIKLDGSAICSYSTSIEETRIQIEQAIYYFDKCQFRYWDTKCNRGKVADELAQSYLLLGRLTGMQRFVGVAFSIFINRKPHANEVGKLECLNWMINHSNIKLESNLSKVVMGMENMLNIFLIFVPFSKLSTNITEQKRNQFLRDCGIENEIGILFINPIHKPRILTVLGKNQDLVTRKTVKTIIDDIPVIYKTIVEDLLTKGKVWFTKIRRAIEEELQKLKTFSIPTGQSDNTGDRSRKVSFTPDEFLQLIRLDMHNVKLESFLNECKKKLHLRWEQKRILYQFEQKRFPFSKCRRLMADLIHTIPHISNAKSDLLQSLNGVQSQMEVYFESELMSSNRIGGNVARMFEVIFFHKILGLQRNMNESLTNLESMVLREMKKTTLSRQNAFNCGFISKLNVHKPFAMSVVRSFKESLDCLMYRRNPSIALKKYCIFIDRIKKQQTKETIPELTLLLIWVRYFTLVGFSMQSKVCGMQNSGKKYHFVIPSSYFNTFKFVEQCVFYSKTWTTEAIIGASKLMLKSGEISDLLENNIEIMAGIRGNINIISIVFRRLDEYLQLQESPKQLLKDDEALSSIIDMAEDVISLSMVYIINMREGMSCRLESFLLKEFALLRCNETYPKNISEVIDGIQHSSGIADIFMCFSNFLKQKGDSLIKCVWDTQKNRILKAEIESVFNTRETFFLPCTIEILSNPTLSAEKINDEIQTEEQEIEVDEEEVRTVCEEHDTIRKKEIESILQTMRAKQSKQSGGTIEYDEFLEDDLFAGIISVNETRCDVCGYTFKSEGIDDKEEEEGAEINTSVESVTESPISTKSNLIGLKSIPRSLSSTETMSGETPTKAQSRIPIKHLFDVTSSRSSKSLSERSVSSESQENKEFFRSLSSSSDELVQMTMNSFEEHRESLSHKSKMKQIQDFYTYYKQELKPSLENVRTFISKYELFSSDTSGRYGGDEIRVSKLLSSFKECNAYTADIITLKNWKQTRQVKEKIELLVSFQNGLNDSVKDLFSVSLKTETLEVEMATEELEYKPHNEKRKRKRRGKGKKAWCTIDFDAM